ncbi:MAG: hypothetical protein ABI650_04345 [Dokdonella sp.]
MRKFIRTVLLGACLLTPFAAHAGMPAAQVYADPDPSAVGIRAGPGRAADFRKKLNSILSRDPDNVVALSHRAYLFIGSGDEELARRDFDRALESSTYGSAEHRQVLWAYGWALYDMNDVDGALRMWELCARLHAGYPYWVAYTYALAYWTKRDPATSLAWYDVAARSDPRRGDPIGVVELTERWRPEQRKEMTALFDAWNARRNAGARP